MENNQVLRRAYASLVVALAIGCGSARADVVTEWNVVALNATAIPANSVLQSRSLAIVHAAIYDAVQAVERKGGHYAAQINAPTGASLEAAVAASAHTTLLRLAPAQRPMLDAALQTSLAKIPDGQGKLDGMQIGTRIADEVLSLRNDDGADAKGAFNAKAEPGYYQATPPHMMAPILPQWGNVKLFVLRERTGVELKGPPNITGAVFARDFDEVKRLGSRKSVARNADQTAAAIFWTVQTAVPWNAAARAIAGVKNFSIAENARMFAVLAFATADSQIVAFEAKYKHPFWRPITAIRAAGGLKDSRLKADPTWEPLLGTPPHPEYPSAHAIFSGAAESVLRAFLGDDNLEVSVTVPPVLGVTRSYQRLSEITADVENARVWGGIHFRSASQDGVEVGRKIGTIVLHEFNKTRAH